MGYEIILCKVLAIDLQKRSVTLEPLNSPFLDSINVDAATGLRFTSMYAPFLSSVDVNDNKINGIPLGSVNYPQPNDRILALVWITDMSDDSRPAVQLAQNHIIEVIILAKVVWNHPNIGPYDNIIGDRSGARLHLNHGWLDEVNVKDLPPEYIESGNAAKAHHLRTGHVTLVGNRVVRLAGKKFLAFGLFSHIIGRAKSGRSGIVFPDSPDPEKADGQAETGIRWDEVFTQDPTEDIFDGLLDKSRGSKKFLEPPCPEPGDMMDMHDSGYKLLVTEDGHVREYYPKGRIIIIGQDASQNEKKMSFDPTMETYSDVAEGVYQIELVSGAKTLTLKFDPTNDIVELTTSSGKFKVTGNIEATLDIKGGTGTFG